MKLKIASIVCIISLCGVCILCQDTNLKAATDVSQMTFCSVIVKNVNTSAAWYQQVLHVTLKTSDDSQPGAKVRILESPVMIIELLELANSVDPDPVLSTSPAGTQMQGHFKVGFRLSDFDGFLTRLRQLGVSVPQVYGTAAAGNRNFIVTDPDGNLLQFFE